MSCKQHQDVEVYGLYGQRGCMDCVTPTQQSDELDKILLLYSETIAEKYGARVGTVKFSREQAKQAIQSLITQQTQEAVEAEVHEEALLLIKKYKKLVQAQSEVIATLRAMLDTQLKANTNKEGQ